MYSEFYTTHIYLWRVKLRSRLRAGQEAATKANGTEKWKKDEGRTKNSDVCPSARLTSVFLPVGLLLSVRLLLACWRRRVTVGVLFACRFVTVGAFTVGVLLSACCLLVGLFLSVRLLSACWCRRALK